TAEVRPGLLRTGRTETGIEPARLLESPNKTYVKPSAQELEPMRSSIRPLDDDLADLDHRRDVGVLGDVVQGFREREERSRATGARKRHSGVTLCVAFASGPNGQRWIARRVPARSGDLHERWLGARASAHLVTVTYLGIAHRPRGRSRERDRTR